MDLLVIHLTTRQVKRFLEWMSSNLVLVKLDRLCSNKTRPSIGIIKVNFSRIIILELIECQGASSDIISIISRFWSSSMCFRDGLPDVTYQQPWNCIVTTNHLPLKNPKVLMRIVSIKSNKNLKRFSKFIRQRKLRRHQKNPTLYIYAEQKRCRDLWF